MKHVWQWIRVALAAALLLVALGGTAEAAVPGNVAFSGHLSDADGPIDGSVALTFRLFDAAVDGTQVWTETQNATAEQGLVLAELGLESPLDETIFDGNALFLEVSVNGTALSPRAPIGTVPYAFAANHADSATHADHAETASLASDSSQLGGVAASSWQRRVTDNCAPGTYMRAIASNGVVTCQADANTVYAAGSGLSLIGSTFQISSSGVGTGQLANNSVTTAKIPDGAVTGAKLANPTIHGPGTATNKQYCALLGFNGSAACTVLPPPIRPGNWSLSGAGCQWICL